MKKPDINDKIQKLMLQNDLGAEITVQKIAGGLSHNMYRVATDKALYAVKQLNPAVMCKKEAYRNFVFSEKTARVAKKNGINAVCALRFRGKVVLKEEDSFFMIFDWVNAQTLSAEQVQDKHCEIVGQTLAKLHNINFRKQKNIKPKNAQTEPFDLDKYLSSAKEQGKPFAQRLQNNMELLSTLRQLSAAATNNLNNDLVVSHRDLDRKNVMWQSFTPFLIDWEASGSIDPALELVQVAWYWAGGDVESLDLQKFETLIKSYVEEYRGKICADHADLVYANVRPKLDWLQYNLQRAFVETEFESAELADNEVVDCLKELEYCVSQFDNVVKALKNCF